MNRYGALLLAASIIFAVNDGAVCAAESTQELRLGGISITRSSEVHLSFDSIDVAINPDVISAKYKISNLDQVPAAVTLNFPMPDLDFSDPDVSYAIPGSDPLNFVGLSTKIDNKPGGFSFSQLALLNGKDVTSVLRQNKLSLVPVGAFQNQLNALMPEAIEKLASAGLIVQMGNDIQGNALYFPAWTVKTTGSRKASIPVGRPLDIELRYRTSVGTSPDTPLRNPLRGDRALSAQVQRYKQDYCVDDIFYSSLDRITAQTDANTSRLKESRIVYGLKGRDGSEVVKALRIVVDKGRPDRLVSFCLDNLKRISPTSFEMRANDYVAERDLKVLLIGKN